MIKIILIFNTIISICYSQFLISNNGPCSCDFTPNVCDIGCCCDSICTSLQIQSFKCSLNQISPEKYGCIPSEIFFGNNTSFNINNDGSQICIYSDNYSLRNFYYPPNVSKYSKYYETTASSPIIYPSLDLLSRLNSSLYKYGDSIYFFEKNESVGILTMTVSSENEACSDGIPIRYLTSQTVTCRRLIGDLKTDCPSLPSVIQYYKPNISIANFPSAMLRLYNDSSNLFTAPNYFCNGLQCNLNNLIAPSISSSVCVNVVTSVIITISGELTINNVRIDIKTSNDIKGTFDQRSEVIFNKTGLSSSAPQYSGNPGYLIGKPLRVMYRTNQTTLKWSIPSGGDCGNVNKTVILFGFNMENDCKFILGNETNSNVINNMINSSLSNTLPISVSPFGNSNTSTANEWNPLIFENLTSPPGNASTMQLITKQSIYILYARNGTLTLPQNKIIGVKISYTYSDIAINTSQIWISISVTFVDVSLTPYDVNAAVIRMRSKPSVKDFLYLFYVENSANRLVEIKEPKLLLKMFLIVIGAFLLLHN